MAKGGIISPEDIREVLNITGQAMESGCNTPAGAEDFIHTAQAKALIPGKEDNIQAATGQVMDTAGKGAGTGEVIRGEIN